MDTDQRTQPADGNFRFSLAHAFVFVTLACVYFALVQGAGHLLAMLFLAYVILLAALHILRIQSLVIGSVVGSAISLFLCLASVALCRHVGSGEFVLAVFLAPIIGYATGMSISASEAWRLGV